MVEAPEKIWPLGGYAPGNYLCKCHACEKQFNGDKRAITCIECAVSGVKRQIAELRAERDDLLVDFRRLTKRAETLAAENARLGALPLKDEVERVVRALLERDEQNTCTHEETHRGGFLWEICDQCGAKWAEEQGGKPDWTDPPE